MEIFTMLHPLLPYVIAAVGLVVWFVRLEGRQTQAEKTTAERFKASEKEIERLWVQHNSDQQSTERHRADMTRMLADMRSELRSDIQILREDIKAVGRRE